VANFTHADLQAILDKCLPDDEAVRLESGNLDTDLEELGYDSLVIAELAVRLHDDYGVSIPDDVLDDLKTPAALVMYVSPRIPATQQPQVGQQGA
jgi:act minimal PKS acyl carrier protein